MIKETISEKEHLLRQLHSAEEEHKLAQQEADAASKRASSFLATPGMDSLTSLCSMEEAALARKKAIEAYDKYVLARDLAKSRP